MAKIGDVSGPFQAVWRYCSFISESIPIDTDDEHWELRAYLLSKDQDRQCGDLPPLLGLLLRRN